MKGLYSPLTKNNNFYIYANNKGYNLSKSDLILVHCYSQIRNPQNVDKYLTPLLTLISVLTFRSEENYVNPLFTYLRHLLEW